MKRGYLREGLNSIFHILKKYWLAVAILIVFTIAYNLFLNSTHFLKFVDIVKENLFLTVAFLITLKVLGLVWPPLSGGITVFIFLPVFGIFKTYLIDLAGTLLGATLSYFIAKWLNRKLVTSLVGNAFIEKVSKIKIREDKELEAVILASIVFAAPMIEVVSYASGFLKVKYRNMIIGVLIGHFIWTIPAYFVVNNLLEGEHLAITAFLILAGVLIIFLLKDRYFTFFERDIKK